MSQIMGGAFSSPFSLKDFNGDISNIIKSAFSETVSLYSIPSNAYCGVTYPQGNYLLINLQDSNSASSVQFVMNTITGAWCKFTNQNAIHWVVWNNDLYFLSDEIRIVLGVPVIFSNVYLADNGEYDEDGYSPGDKVARSIKLRQAYNFLDNPTTVKSFTSAKVYTEQTQGLQLTLGCDVDFDNVPATSSVSDNTTLTSKLYKPVMGLKGIGEGLSLRIDQETTEKSMDIYGTKVFWKEGGNL